MSDCIFCKIISGEIKAKIIREDSFTLSFLDLNPQAPTHVLIIPKKHIVSLASADEGDMEILGRLQLAAAETARLLKAEKAFRLVTNSGKGAGQSVDHLHYHLLAGRKLLWPPG
ncbi:MAG: histidine triad nucleotide-binding protein [Elusimicrobiales bacterium]|nr:histidine triad nucleotide-binding protein [Elusimicrobiales bacterium]